MTKEELWDAYCARNPQFAGEGTVTMTCAGLKKFFDQTFEKGFEQGWRCLPDKPKASKGPDPFEIYEKMFGKKKP